MMFRPRGLCAFILAALLITPATVHAQSWLEQGTKLLEGLTSGGDASALTNTDIIAGLREALTVGADRVVGTLGKADGFNAAPDVRIPLPDSLNRVQSVLDRVGFGGLGRDVELRMNRAAESAVPKAKTLFQDAITSMTIEDAKGILNGPNDAATQYFKGRMSTPLKAEMKPIVDAQLAEVGAVQALDRMIGQYKAVPFVPDVKADLTDHVLTKAIDGVFLYLAREEAAIRENPAQRTTELLQKVFQ